MEFNDENKKERLDVLVSRKYNFSREYSKQAIETGNVFVNGMAKLKPGEKIDASNEITATADKMKYVSRGGFKLEKALDIFGIDLENKVCVDVGASTGGFTDCMLQRGASKVFAVDTGFGQLSQTLASNSKVVLMEKTNILNVSLNDLKEEIQFISVDVSFVSVAKIMGAISLLIGNDGEAVLLIKPQFEAGRSRVGKKGIVKNPKLHKSIIQSIYSSMNENNINVLGLSFSPIKGQDGNIEYLIYGSKRQKSIDGISFKALTDNVVSDAFNKFQ